MIIAKPDPRLAAIAERVRREVGPVADSITTIVATLAAMPAATAFANEVTQIGKAAH